MTFLEQEVFMLELPQTYLLDLPTYNTLIFSHFYTL